ncbi:unnamed protein product, partial [Echinostoma caproni]|uniref:RRM domain-containing protein n=1 Tax=Echinostoma caproni TaxID=27848 RepID=A0A183B4S7_9TREM
HLNKQNIYTGCCCLTVEFSKTRGPLEVRRQNDKCRDYVASPLTKEELAAGEVSDAPQLSTGNMICGGNAPLMSLACSSPNGPMLSNSSHSPGITELAAQLTMLAQQSGLILTPAVAAATASFMALTSQGASGSTGMSSSPPGLILGSAALGNPPSALVSSQSQFTPAPTLQPNSGMGPPSTSVLIVSNLHEEPLWGKNLKVALSKFNVVQMPNEGTDVGLTKDYSRSPLHRFRKPNSKNFLNICAPNHVLHLSNIPPNSTEDEIRKLFLSKGYEVSGFKFMLKEKKMALVQLANVDVAMQALIEDAD